MNLPSCVCVRVCVVCVCMHVRTLSHSTTAIVQHTVLFWVLLFLCVCARVCVRICTHGQVIAGAVLRSVSW